MRGRLALGQLGDQQADGARAHVQDGDRARRRAASGAGSGTDGSVLGSRLLLSRAPGPSILAPRRAGRAGRASLGVPGDNPVTTRRLPPEARTTALLRDRVKRVFRELPGALAGEEEAVHQVRVAGRRLRVALPLLRPQGPRPAAAAGRCKVLQAADAGGRAPGGTSTCSAGLLEDRLAERRPATPEQRAAPEPAAHGARRRRGPGGRGGPRPRHRRPAPQPAAAAAAGGRRHDDRARADRGAARGRGERRCCGDSARWASATCRRRCTRCGGGCAGCATRPRSRTRCAARSRARRRCGSGCRTASACCTTTTCSPPGSSEQARAAAARERRPSRGRRAANGASSWRKAAGCTRAVPRHAARRTSPCARSRRWAGASARRGCEPPPARGVELVRLLIVRHAIAVPRGTPGIPRRGAAADGGGQGPASATPRAGSPASSIGPTPC